MAGRIRRLGLALLAGYLVLALAAGYWQAVRADELDGDPVVNGERMEAEADRIVRGRILDRRGRVLAETIVAEDGSTRRVYPEPATAHIVGYVSPLRGSIGAERAAGDLLAGRRPGSALSLVRDLLHLPREGDDVRLSIDLDIQRAAVAAMGDGPGAAIAIDPRNGDVLALVSRPGFDPNTVEDQWDQLRTREDSPLVNRATQGRYIPGSTFKTVTLIAALEAGLVSPDDPASCPAEIEILGQPIVSYNEPPGLQTETVADAYAYSCNTFFAELGVELGPERLRETAAALGLEEPPPFDLPTAPGSLGTTEYFLEDDRGLAMTAFGQGELQLTPLHLVLMAAAVANDGRVPEPRLFAGELASTWRRPMSARTARAMASVMEHSVEVGWAQTAAIGGVRVAGKTGTAEIGDGESHAVFIAFAPVDDPQIAVAVLRERAGSGSREAGPVARAIIEAALAR